MVLNPGNILEFSGELFKKYQCMSPLPDQIESESLGGGWGVGGGLGISIFGNIAYDSNMQPELRSTDLGLNGDSDPRTMNDHVVCVLDDAIADLSPAGSSRGK